MNIALWIVQALLALVYVMAGGLKTFRPLAELGKQMTWVSTAPAWQVRLIGVAELLGAIGLILPMVTHIAPWLTVAAAGGLALVQVGAFSFHSSRRESRVLPGNVVLLLLALLVVVGRLTLAPIA